MSECPCETKFYGWVSTYSTQSRPRDVSQICLDCRFSWGAKE